MFEKLTPIHDKVMVKRQAPETQTAGGLYLPEEVVEQDRWAKVIAVGAGRLTMNGGLVPLTVQPGDLVYLVEYPSSDSVDEEFIIKEDEILGYIR